MPATDVRERFERRIEAPPGMVMQAAYDFDMQSIFLIWLIVRIRKFILGGTPDEREPMGIVEETRRLGWGTLAEEPGKLLICGARCQPWFGDVIFTPIPADEFVAYNEPDQVKIVWSLEATEVQPNTTLFVHEVRALATDAGAKKKFGRYWRWARFGIIAIRILLLPAIRRKAERNWRSR